MIPYLLRPSRPFAVHQPCQALFVKAAHPVGHGPGRIAQQFGNLPAAHALGHQEQAMQPVVASRLWRPTDLVLHRCNYYVRVGHRELFHAQKIARRACMRIIWVAVYNYPSETPLTAYEATREDPS